MRSGMRRVPASSGRVLGGLNGNWWVPLVRDHRRVDYKVNINPFDKRSQDRDPASGAYRRAGAQKAPKYLG